MKTSQDTVKQFLDDLDYLPISNDDAFEGDEYRDPFATHEQMKRDREITKLLADYVEFYHKKVKHNTVCRYLILIPCMLIICVFAGVLIWLTLQITKLEAEVQIPSVVAFITACISFISLIIGLLTIITKYFFPENDEQYITAIVESIQRNDLENKRENAKNSSEKADIK